METAIHIDKTKIRVWPEIRFNMDSCLGALDCGKCLQACLFNVMRCYTPMPEGKAKNSKDWIPIATFPSLCTGCLRCVQVCPKSSEGAIDVSFKRIRLPVK
ncbi:4Fe-4S dicluster domain-containing protein [Chloroflexota bacterium]